jgi:hypothetical protein
MTLTPRRGFALLAVLWLTTGAAALGMVIAALGREAIGTAYNRQRLSRAEWRAEDCLARVRAVLAAERNDDARPSRNARSLPELLANAPLVMACPGTVQMQPAGLRLDLNALDAASLRRTFVHQRIDAAAADSLTDAILDWRDADDDARPRGAEGAWYAEHVRKGPRNGPFAAVGELRLVRGFERTDARLGALEDLFSVEPGRVLVPDAPDAVLTTLPGFTDEMLWVAARLREDANARQLNELVDLTAELSPAGRAEIEHNYVALSRLATVRPDAWLLRIKAHGGILPADTTALAVELHVRLERAGSRLAVRHRYLTP